jgi:Holliday junction resolvasome RuvABC endonuclease subunit
MKFISIDSSLANTGIAVGTIGPTDKIFIEKIDLASTEKSKHKQIRASSDAITRCRKTYRFVDTLIKEEKPNVIFMETPSGSQSSSGMKSYGATCMLIASISPAPIEVTPTEVKVESVGTKTASKQEMIAWAHALYPEVNWFYHANKLQNKNEHMADAIAIAYAGIETEEFKRLKSLIKKI